MKKIIILSCVMLLLCSGCALFQRNTTFGSSSEPKKEGPNQVFYGFPDVPIPQELNLINDRSFVYETSSFKTGVLFLTGNVELQSLENYFKINMPKNGWRYVNNIRYRNIVLNYVKDDKTCNIRISKDTFTADVEIWVGPVEKGIIQKSNEAIVR